MKIVFISDIHANLYAFESVLARIKKDKPDRIVFLGDASTLGMRPQESLDLLESLKCDCILGNHDEFMIEPEKINRYTKDKLVIDTVEWSRTRHLDRHIAFIKTFKRELRIPLTEGTDIFCYHGSPASNMENVKPESGVESFVGLIHAKPDTIFIGGHTHVQMLRNYNGTRIVTSGSVGQPFVGYGMPPSKHPWAEYVVIESVGKRQYDIQFRQVEIDNDKINREILASDSPMNDFISEY
jgi:predicted phosphodiesterase